MERTAGECLTRNPVTIAPHGLATRALDLMEERRITSLLVTGGDGRVAGVVHLHELWKTEMI